MIESRHMSFIVLAYLGIYFRAMNYSYRDPRDVEVTQSLIDLVPKLRIER